MGNGHAKRGIVQWEPMSKFPLLSTAHHPHGLLYTYEISLGSQCVLCSCRCLWMSSQRTGVLEWGTFQDRTSWLCIVENSLASRGNMKMLTWFSLTWLSSEFNITRSFPSNEFSFTGTTREFDLTLAVMHMLETDMRVGLFDAYSDSVFLLQHNFGYSDLLILRITWNLTLAYQRHSA